MMLKWLVFLIYIVAFCPTGLAQQNHVTVSTNITWVPGRNRGTELAMHRQYSNRNWVASRITSNFEKDDGSELPISFYQIQVGSASQITPLNKRAKIFMEAGVAVIYDRNSSIYWSSIFNPIIDPLASQEVRKFYLGIYTRSDFRLPLFNQFTLVGGLGYSGYPSVRNVLEGVLVVDARLGIGYQFLGKEEAIK
jgi:hypothetical protein